MNQLKFNPIFHFLPFIGAILLGYSSSAGTQNSSSLTVIIQDAETGEQTPARITLTDRQGNHTKLPDEAIKVMYGRNDTAEGYGFQPDSSFYVDGLFSLDLTLDVHKLTITKGNEYFSQNHSLDLTGGDLDTTFVMERWINMPERGWYSSDDHIHVRRSARENPLLLPAGGGRAYLRYGH